MTIKNKENPYVSIIIPTYKRKKDLQKLITSISETEYNKKCLEIIVVDNAGTISDVDIKNHTRISLNIVKPKTNLYCSGGRRFGASIAKGNYLFFVDDDNILDKSCINYLVKELEVDNDIGVVGPIMLLFNDKKRIWSAGGIINKMGLPKYKFDGKNIDELNLPSVIRDIDFFPNAFMVRKELLSSINFDIKNFPHNWSEPDFCLRIKNSGKIVATITSAIEWHNIGYSGPLTRTNKLNIRDQAKSRILFRKRFFYSLKDKIMFWGLIFPVSSIFYFKAITKSSDSGKFSILLNYFKATFEGLKTPIKKEKYKT